MLIRSNEIESGSTLEADLVVVGSGPAGMSVARHFDGSSLRVILLESGGSSAEAATNALNQGLQSGRKYFDLDRCRSRFLGGSSNCWSGWCAPFDEDDFRARDWLPHSGWPIDYETLKPWYARATSELEISPLRDSVGDWESEGRPLWNFQGGRVKSGLFQFSPPTRLGRLHRAQLQRSENLRCILHATVSEIELDPSGAAVRALRVKRSLGGGEFKVRARRYVIACGGIDNPRLLLASRGVQRAGVGNAHDQVGRYFMEHPHLYTEGRFFGAHGLPDSKFYQRHRVEGQRVIGFLKIDPAVRAQEQILNLSMCFRPAGGRTDAQTRALWYATQETDGGPKPTRLAARRFVLDVRSEQAPNPESRITLSSERDALGIPRADLHWALSAIDKRSVRRSQEIVAQDLARSGLGRFRITLDDSPRFPEKMEGGCHHLGTTRMHEDPRQGVVDRDCRVHGIHDLFLAGSSVFTTGSSANPTLTIVALALRLAETLQRELS